MTVTARRRPLRLRACDVHKDAAATALQAEQTFGGGDRAQ